jgi:hypothetical protein
MGATAKLAGRGCSLHGRGKTIEQEQEEISTRGRLAFHMFLLLLRLQNSFPTNLRSINAAWKVCFTKIVLGEIAQR